MRRSSRWRTGARWTTGCGTRRWRAWAPGSACSPSTCAVMGCRVPGGGVLAPGGRRGPRRTPRRGGAASAVLVGPFDGRECRATRRAAPSRPRARARRHRGGLRDDPVRLGARRPVKRSNPIALRMLGQSRLRAMFADMAGVSEPVKDYARFGDRGARRRDRSRLSCARASVGLSTPERATRSACRCCCFEETASRTALSWGRPIGGSSATALGS